MIDGSQQEESVTEATECLICLDLIQSACSIVSILFLVLFAIAGLEKHTSTHDVITVPLQVLRSRWVLYFLGSELICF